MAINIDYLTDKYFSNGISVPYELKKGGIIEIKPILLKDKYIYDLSIEVLQFQKNEIEDPKIISMSYLEFLIKYLFNEENEKRNRYISQLSWLLENCLGYDNVAIGEDKNKVVLTILNEDNTIEKIINQKEFDDISKIILNQNDANYDNRYISPDVREMMQEYYKAKYRDVASPSLEKKKAFVCSKIGKTFQEIGEIFTCREFDLIYDEILNSEIYIGEKIIQGSFKYDVKEDVRHPMYREKADPYKEIFEDTSVLGSKGIKGAEQLSAMNYMNNK